MASTNDTPADYARLQKAFDRETANESSIMSSRDLFLQLMEREQALQNKSASLEIKYEEAVSDHTRYEQAVSAADEELRKMISQVRRIICSSNHLLILQMHTYHALYVILSLNQRTHSPIAFLFLHSETASRHCSQNFSFK